MPDRVTISIGTKKGLFIAEGAKPRRKFTLRGPFGPGVPVYSTLIDTRGKPKIYSSSCNPFFGMKVLRSTDLGRTFKETRSAPAFSKDDGRALANIWALEPGPEKQEVWAGVEVGGVFASADGGRSWSAANEEIPSLDVHGLAWSSGGILLAATPRGVAMWRSARWMEGLFEPADRYCRALATRPDDPGMLYCGFGDGLHRGKTAGRGYPDFA